MCCAMARDNIDAWPRDAKESTGGCCVGGDSSTLNLEIDLIGRMTSE